MATTTNFGWETPDDTDLVKDGAAAMRTLGNSIDTSFVDLKGGTSGQMLTKASNTDLDYTWVTPEIGDITAITASSPLTGGGTTGAVTVGILDGTTSNKGAVQLSTSTSSTSTSLAATASAVKSAYDLADAAIPKSLIDAAGDLIVGTADNTAGRVAIGTAGQVLKVNSGATGVEWGAGGGGGGLVFLDRQSFSSVSSFSFTNKFSSTYDNYKIILRITGGGQVIWSRLRSSTTDNTSSNYRSGRMYQLGTGVTGVGDTTGTQTYFQMITEHNSQSSFLSMDLYSPYLTDYTGYVGHTSYYYSGYGQHNQITSGQMSVTTSYDGITFYPNASTMTGEVTLYGYARS
jgi:hypothetical protein